MHDTRRKIADALINGKRIEMAGCTRRLEGHCPQRNQDMCPKKGGGICPKTTMILSGKSDKRSETPDQ